MINCRKSLYLYFTLLILSIFLVSCSDEDTTEEITVRVISYGGNFIGTYWQDGDSGVTFTGDRIGNDTYEYEKDLEIENQVEVEADAIYDDDGDNPLTSLEIKIYVDGDLADSIQDTSDVEKISITYESGDYDSSDSDSD